MPLRKMKIVKAPSIAANPYFDPQLAAVPGVTRKPRPLKFLDPAPGHRSVSLALPIYLLCVQLAFAINQSVVRFMIIGYCGMSSGFLFSVQVLGLGVTKESSAEQVGQ